MTKDEMRVGLLAGRQLAQEEWATREEIAAADELIAEGVAIATPWERRSNFQCEVRFVRRAAPTIRDGGKP
jgi:hypothetical protein